VGLVDEIEHPTGFVKPLRYEVQDVPVIDLPAELSAEQSSDFAPARSGLPGDRDKQSRRLGQRIVMPSLGSRILVLCEVGPSPHLPLGSGYEPWLVMALRLHMPPLIRKENLRRCLSQLLLYWLI